MMMLARTEDTGLFLAPSGRYVVFRRAAHGEDCFVFSERGAIQEGWLCAGGVGYVTLAECLTEASARAAFALLTGS
jgi:hypothetical protein